MPSDDGFWFDDQQGAFPGTKDVCENAEEDSIGRSDLRSGRCASQYLQLLSEIHDFQLEKYRFQFEFTIYTRMEF